MKYVRNLGAILVAVVLLCIAGYPPSQAQTGGGNPPPNKIGGRYISTAGNSTTTSRLVWIPFSVFFTSSSVCTVDSQPPGAGITCSPGLGVNSGQMGIPANTIPSVIVACTCSADGLHTSGTTYIAVCSLDSRTGTSARSPTISVNNGAGTATNADCIISGY